jgi:tetratricopeptide (TPR) repeat protein
MRKTLALSLLALAVVATNAFAVTEARLGGKIVDAATKAPIPNAIVLITSATAAKNFRQEIKAKSDGSYAVFLLDGTIQYKFTYSAPGYAPDEEVMKLNIGGQLNEKNVELTKATGAAPANAAPSKVDPAVVAYNEGAALANDGKDAEALAKFDEAETHNPSFTAAWVATARIGFRAKKYQKSVDAANKAVALGADESEMAQIMAEDYTALGDKAKAAEARKKAPADPHALYNEAAKFLNANKDADAEPLLKQAIAADDKFALAYFQLGMVYVRSGKNADAKANLLKYLELDPKGPEAGTATEMLKYIK